MKMDIELLKTEPVRVEAQPGRVVRLNGVRYMVFGVALGAGSSRQGEVVVYSDMDTGQMFYRTLANFTDQMAWNVVKQEEEA